MNLQKIISQKIKDDGPITIAEYMNLCLAHPEFGYYMKRDPLGERGDFITAPEISQIFGELIGLWLASQWKKLESPQATLLEAGPGRGTLMADILRATKNIPNFHDSIKVRLLEISPALKQKQWNSLAGKHSNIEWIESLDGLENEPLLLVANEFFDALPIEQSIYTEDKWKQRLIDLNDDKLVFTTSDNNVDNISAGDIPLDELKDGLISESCSVASEITKKISTHIVQHGGAGLIVDYGYRKGKGDTLQAMKEHHYHDILLEPGEADITAHVDFSALIGEAITANAKVFGPAPQGKFLMQIGAGQRVQKLCTSATREQSAELISGLERLASPDKMGDLFKVLAITSSHIEHAEGF